MNRGWMTTFIKDAYQSAGPKKYPSTPPPRQSQTLQFEFPVFSINVPWIFRFLCQSVNQPTYPTLPLFYFNFSFNEFN